MFDSLTAIAESRVYFPQRRLLGFPVARRVVDEDRVEQQSRSDDELNGFFRFQNELLRRGQVVWGVKIQANSRLFTPGRRAYPAEYVCSLDPHFDSHLNDLEDIAERIYDLKGTEPKDPALREVADHITDEMHRALGERIPAALTGGREVVRHTVFVCPRHLPHAFLSYSTAPMLVRPRGRFAMLLPYWYWSRTLLEAWEPTAAHQALIDAERPTQLVRASDDALVQFRQVYAQQKLDPHEQFVRIETDGEIRLGFDDRRLPGDQSITLGGVTFVLDERAAKESFGVEIDYHELGDGQCGFTVRD